MSIVSYIVIALAFGLVNMLLFRRCGEATPVRLSAGLLIILGQSAIHAVMFYLGGLLGMLLCLHSVDAPGMYDDINAYIFLGIVVAVIVRMLFPYLRKEPRLPMFDLDQGLRFILMTLVTGINVFLVGLGAGFVEEVNPIHKMVWPMFIASLLLGYWGLMLGRQKVEMRPRRWMVVACVLLLGTAIAACVNAG
ncbi:MAG: hypothetical protein IJ524_01010 [Bacteroidales bacterium]|nr:hypothetical protein [Bacteroidales bacterium]